MTTTRRHAPGSAHALDVARRVAAIIVGLAVLAAVAGAATGPVTAQIEAPQRGTPLAAVWLDVGETAAVDVSSAFVGPVDSYSARSQDATAVSFSIAGSTLSLTALVEGVAFIEIAATNEAGSLSQWIGVASGIPRPGAAGGTPTPHSAVNATEESATPTASDADDSEPIGIAVAAQAFCYAPYAGEMVAEGVDRDSVLFEWDKVGTLDLSYAVIGGRPPFAISSPSLRGATSARSGVLELACAHLAPRAAGSAAQLYYAYRVGPFTVTIEVSDADGGTTRTELLVHMSTAIVRVNNGDGTESAVLEVPGLADPGRSYVLGTPTALTLVTLAPGLNIRFIRLDTEGVAYFADPHTGWVVHVDWVTGAELGRTAGAIPSTNRLILDTWPIPDPGDVRQGESDMSPAPPGWEDPTDSGE